MLTRLSLSRAKIKLLAKKSIETGEDCDQIPESMRNYLMVQAMESGKPLAREIFGRTANSMTPYGNGTLLNPESANPGKVGKLSVATNALGHLYLIRHTSYPSLHL